MIGWIKDRWDSFMNPIPKGTTNFYGDMDMYRARVNSDAALKNMSRLEMSVLMKSVMEENERLGKYNQEVNIEKQKLIKIADELVEIVNALKEDNVELESKVRNMSVLNKENANYDADMKGMVL